MTEASPVFPPQALRGPVPTVDNVTCELLPECPIAAVGMKVAPDTRSRCGFEREQIGHSGKREPHRANGREIDIDYKDKNK